MSRTYRKRSHRRLVVDIVQQMRRHPVSGASFTYFLLRSGRWQIRKRLIRRPDNRVLSWGYTLRCYPDSSSASNVVYFSEFFDYPEMCFLSRYLRPGDSVVDGGANVGVYTLLMAYLVGEAGSVDSYEPESVAFARLKESVATNTLDQVVTCHRAALGSEAGAVAFTNDADVSNRVAAASDHSRPVEMVDMQPLGPQIRTRQYALVKLDVEGYELNALRGMAEELKDGNPPVLLIELIPPLLQKAGYRVEDVVGFLDKFGYDVFRYREDDRRLVPAQNLRGNVFAIHEKALEVVSARLRGPVPSGVQRFVGATCRGVTHTISPVRRTPVR